MTRIPTPESLGREYDHERRIQRLERKPDFIQSNPYRTHDLGNIHGTCTITVVATDQDILVVAKLIGNVKFRILGLRDGVSITYVLTQDSVGGRTTKFIPEAATPRGRQLKVITTPGAKNVITTFSSDGLDYYAFLAGSDMKVPAPPVLQGGS